MSLALEDLRVLQKAELVSDAVWKAVTSWEVFPRDAFGKQMVEAADSIGANIAESFGRFNYGEKVTFLYYARGSLFEAKYWINRALARGLLTSSASQLLAGQLTEIARQLNALATATKEQRAQHGNVGRTVREPEPVYADDEERPPDLFSPEDLAWLAEQVPITDFQLPLTNSQLPSHQEPL